MCWHPRPCNPAVQVLMGLHGKQAELKELLEKLAVSAGSCGPG